MCLLGGIFILQSTLDVGGTRIDGATHRIRSLFAADGNFLDWRKEILGGLHLSDDGRTRDNEFTIVMKYNYNALLTFNVILKLVSVLRGVPPKLASDFRAATRWYSL